MARRRPFSLENFDWNHLLLDHCWQRTLRREVTHARLVELEQLVRDFVIRHPHAVEHSIAEARARSDDPGMEDVFEILHPLLKAFALERGIDLTDNDPVPY